MLLILLCRIDILITNPPFYASEAELISLSEKKSRPPNSACTGAPVEMIYPGGEIEFVTKLIQESALPHNRVKIKWFSSMFGKLASLNIIIDRLREKGCTNYAVTEFVQGQRTRRWCVAWSWTGMRPALEITRGTDAVEKKYLPFPTELDIVVTGQTSEIKQNIEAAIAELEGVEWHWIANTFAGIGSSNTGDVWSRRARRRLQKLAADHDSMDVDKGRPANDHADHPSGHEDKDRFVFRITIESAGGQATHDTPKAREVSISVRWLQGLDSTVFESFHGWLKRKIQR